MHVGEQKRGRRPLVATGYVQSFAHSGLRHTARSSERRRALRWAITADDVDVMMCVYPRAPTASVAPRSFGFECTHILP